MYLHVLKENIININIVVVDRNLIELVHKNKEHLMKEIIVLKLKLNHLAKI